jgi:Fibronectin type III domain
MQMRRHPTVEAATMPRRAVTALSLAIVLAFVVASPARAAATDTSPPSIPTGIRATGATESSVTLTWEPATDDVGVAGYHLQWLIGDVLSGLRTTRMSATVTGLNRSHTYEFWLFAFDEAGNESGASDEFRITLPPGDSIPPAVPGPLSAPVVTDTTALLEWGRSRDNIGVGAYEIFQLADGAATQVATVTQRPCCIHTRRLTNLTPATTYVFTVRARDDAGNASDFTAPLTVTTRAAQ